MEQIWSKYLVLRIIIGIFDGLSDILLSAHLISDGHPYCGLGILAFLMLALVISFLYVLVGRCRRGDPMTAMKYMLMTLKVHAEVVSAYFQGAPSLIVQLAIVWSGVYLVDFEAFAQTATWRWFWAWLEVVGILTSFISLVFTTVSYNDEPGPSRRVFWSIVSSILTCMYRAFVISIMFKLSPIISCVIFAIFYLFTICILYFWGDDSSSFLHAYCCLFLPVGHTYGTSSKPGYDLASGIPEAERTRINQAGLFKRVQKFLILHIFYNILLVVPYITFYELWLQTSPELYNIAPILTNRVFMYLTPSVLLITSMLVLFIYYLEARKAVNATTVWTQISTNAAQQPSLQNPSAQLIVENDAAVPIPSSPSRPMSSYAQPVAPSASLNLPHTTDQTPTLPNSTLYPYLPSAPTAPSEAGDIQIAGNRKCENESCVTCAWLLEGPAFFSMVTNKQYRFMPPVTCTDDLLIYLVTCRGCRKQYVGKTEQTLRQRHYGHRREIETQSSPLGQHFGSVCGYNCWSIQIIDKCAADELSRREGYWQHELRTLVPDGLNIRDELGGRLKI